MTLAQQKDNLRRLARGDTLRWFTLCAAATTVVTRSGAWEFSFIAQGWVPQAGEFDATCFLLPGVPWPALVLVEGNICYPRETPKRVG